MEKCKVCGEKYVLEGVNDGLCDDCFDKEQENQKLLRKMKTIYKVDFLKGEKFWCNYCDAHRVDSDKPETGTFYGVFGHISKFDRTKQQQVTEDYEQVVWAVCTECDKE